MIRWLHGASHSTEKEAHSQSLGRVPRSRRRVCNAVSAHTYWPAFLVYSAHFSTRCHDWNEIAPYMPILYSHKRCVIPTYKKNEVDMSPRVASLEKPNDSCLDWLLQRLQRGVRIHEIEYTAVESAAYHRRTCRQSVPERRGLETTNPTKHDGLWSMAINQRAIRPRETDLAASL